MFWSADVVLSQADTLNNHHVNDLLDDLEIAMKMAQWLDGDGNNTGAYVASNISLSAQSGHLMLAATQSFSLLEAASVQLTQLGLVMEGDRVSESQSVHRLSPSIDMLPASLAISQDVRLDLRQMVGELAGEWSIDLTSSLVEGFRDPEQLVGAITDLLLHEGAPVRVEFQDGRLVWIGNEGLQILYSSMNESLLGLTDMPNEALSANRISNSGILPEEVVFNLWVNLGAEKIMAQVRIEADDTIDNRHPADLRDDIQVALNTANWTYLDAEGVWQPYDTFVDDPLTIHSDVNPDPIVQAKLQVGTLKLLLTSQYDFKMLSDEDYAQRLADGAEPEWNSINQSLLGYDQAEAPGGGVSLDSSRPINIHAPAVGSMVTLESSDPDATFYIAGAIVSYEQIQLVAADEVDPVLGLLDLDWSGYLETTHGSIIMEFGQQGHLKGDLVSGDQIRLNAEGDLTISGHLTSKGDIHLASEDLSGDSVLKMTPTAWIRTQPDPCAHAHYVDFAWPDRDRWGHGSLKSSDGFRNPADVTIQSQERILITEASGWVESDGRIQLEAPVVDVSGVIKNASASAPDSEDGQMRQEHFEVILSASDLLEVDGDVDAVGSILVQSDTPLVLRGNIEAGGMESFEFETEARDLIEHADEILLVQAPSLTLDGPRLIASGRVQLEASEGDITATGLTEIYSRLDQSVIELSAVSINLQGGSLRAGWEPNRQDIGPDEPEARGESASILFTAQEMITVGGDEQDEQAPYGSLTATGNIDLIASDGELGRVAILHGSLETESINPQAASSAISVLSGNGVQVFGPSSAKIPSAQCPLIRVKASFGLIAIFVLGNPSIWRVRNSVIRWGLRYPCLKVESAIGNGP